MCFLSKFSDFFLVISGQKLSFLYIYQNMTEILKTGHGAPHDQTFDLTKSLGVDPTMYMHHPIHHRLHRSLHMHLHLTSIHGGCVRYLKNSHLQRPSLMYHDLKHLIRSFSPQTRYHAIQHPYAYILKNPPNTWQSFV